MRISREKKLELLRLALLTVVGLFVVYVILIQPQQRALMESFADVRRVEDKIDASKRKVDKADVFKEELLEGEKKLKAVEEGIVTGDPYLWIINTMRKFQVPGRLEVTNFDPPQFQDSASGFHPTGYRLASFGVSGTGFYQDYVQFLWRFEKAFPNLRIQRLELEPATLAPSAEDVEKLAFRMQVIALVKNPAPRQ
ncbi:MAG: hypothetical protein H7X97_00325 [Opitutaceae bacterium]|nr:hypothetical protein [Verrucomicrobiales bacterium]